MKKKILCTVIMAFSLITGIATTVKAEDINYQESFICEADTKIDFEKEEFAVAYIDQDNALIESDETVLFWKAVDKSKDEVYFTAKAIEKPYYINALNGVNLRTFPNITYNNIVKK